MRVVAARAKPAQQCKVASEAMRAKRGGVGERGGKEVYNVAGGDCDDVVNARATDVRREAGVSVVVHERCKQHGVMVVGERFTVKVTGRRASSAANTVSYRQPQYTAFFFHSCSMLARRRTIASSPEGVRKTEVLEGMSCRVSGAECPTRAVAWSAPSNADDCATLLAWALVLFASFFRAQGVRL